MTDPTPIAEMVRVMLERDVPRDVIVTAIECAERHAETVTRHAIRHVTQRDDKQKAAIRSKRYRENKKRDDGVTPSRDEAKPPLILPSLSSSESQEQKERKENKKVRARRSPSVTLPDNWQPNGGHFEAAERLGRTRDRVLSKADDMRIWAKANDVRKVDWDATFHGFLRRDASNGNGHGPPRERPMTAIELELANDYAKQNGAHHEREPAGDLLDLAAEPAGSGSG